MREIAPSSRMWQKLNLHRTDCMRFYVLLPTSMDQKNSLEDASPVSHPTVYELLNLSDADLRFPFASTSRPAFPRPKAGMFT